MYSQILADHFEKRGFWAPARFKRFPRFAVFTSNKEQLFDKDKFISLNPHVLALLAGIDEADVLKLVQ